MTHTRRVDTPAEPIAEAYRRLPDPVLLTSTDGLIVFVNPAAETLYAYSSAELSGRPLSLIAPTLTGAVIEEMVLSSPDGRWETEIIGARKGGDRFRAKLNVSSLTDRGGSYLGCVCTVHDLSELSRLRDDLRRLEGRLLESQKMEALGLLVGGVAHDFNNLLTATMNYAEMGLMRAPKQGLLVGYFEEIRLASGRAANLTRQLLAFSRRRAIAPEVVDLNRTILDVERMLRHVIRENIELVTLLNPDLRMIKVDPNQMEQVLLNLAVNASDAMPGGGKLVIATCNTYVPEEHAQNQAQLSVGPSVCLSVSDSGVGMTEDVKAHIFEPFFTTKDDGKGTGLGLASCHGIIAQSGGLITVESEPGRGTTFNIYIPAVDETATSPHSEEHTETTPVGTETILLAEDDRFIRSVSGGMLRDLGYSVLEAENGVDAMDNARCLREGRIDLLVADVVMPLMGGAKLATKLAETHPEAKVLLMSGYLDSDTVRPALLAEGREFIQKPFSSFLLARKVRDVIDGA